MDAKEEKFGRQWAKKSKRLSLVEVRDENGEEERGPFCDNKREHLTKK